MALKDLLCVFCSRKSPTYLIHHRIESLLYPSKAAILQQGLLRVSPDILWTLFGELPSRQNIRARKFFRLAVKVVQQVINERLSVADPEGTNDKDLLSVMRKLCQSYFNLYPLTDVDLMLVRANRVEDPKKRLSDEELIAQLM